MALRLYCVVALGEMVRLPGAATPSLLNSPPSKRTSLALLTAPQLNVTDCPAVMVDWEATKVKSFGCPEQPARVGGGVGVGGTAVAGDGTLMTTVRFVPKSCPAVLRRRHTP